MNEFGTSSEALCTWGECTRPEASGGKCHMHLKRQSLGQNMNAPPAMTGGYESSWERFTAACTHWADVDSDDDDAYDRACHRLRRASLKYVLEHKEDLREEFADELKVELPALAPPPQPMRARRKADSEAPRSSVRARRRDGRRPAPDQLTLFS